MSRGIGEDAGMARRSIILRLKAERGESGRMMWFVSLPYDDPIFKATVDELCFNKDVAFDIYELEKLRAEDQEKFYSSYYSKPVKTMTHSKEWWQGM